MRLRDDQITWLIEACQRTSDDGVSINITDPISIVALATEVLESRALLAERSTALGVGDGNGQLFVYGSYEAIKAAQAFIFRAEAAEASVAELTKERDAAEERLAMAHTLVRGIVRQDERTQARVAELEGALASEKAERELLQDVLDSRPAINAGLPETYIRWSQAVYSGDFARAALGRDAT